MGLENNRHVIIAAGGRGSRFNSELPKQFLELSGSPILMRTLETFANAQNKINIILVLPSEHFALWREMCAIHNFSVHHTIAEGGSTRFQSVKSGLAQIENTKGLVAVHDGVRPIVCESLIEKVFNEAFSHGNAVPVVPVVDSLRKVEGKKNFPVPREEFRIVQTPQCFQTAILKEAFKQTESAAFTDEASVVEAFGESINLVAGDPINIKITNPADLIIAESCLSGILS